jgi:rSAM/selenodomain-associated transferase 1
MKKTATIVFIKNPDLGRVKKRLARILGDKKALAIYKGMLEHTLMITRSLSSDKYLFYDREATKGDIWPDDVYIKKVQKGADMATRIRKAFKKIFEKGYQHVVIVGSDCLELDERVIRLAFRQLEHFDCVLGPTKDGGFYLFGMNEFNEQVFKTQGWGTNTLSGEVLKILQEQHKTCFMLSELGEIATVDDLNEDLKKLVK